MKTNISLLALLASLTLASCNLFIEDEEDDLSRGIDLNKKTVYTGDGWSEPVTEVGDCYNITYQYQDNVKLLTEEIQSYIVSFEVDALYGALGIIDFREDTPEQFLPRIGEMVTSRNTKLMPDGLGAEVIWAGFIDGVYRVCTCAVTLDKIFKKLDGEYDLSLADIGDVEANPSIESSIATTRADDGEDIFTVETDGVKLHEEKGDDGKYFQFKLPMKAKISTIKLPEDKNEDTKWKTVHVVDKNGQVHMADEESRYTDVVKRGGTGYLEILPTESFMKHRLRVKVYLLDGSVCPILEVKDTVVTDATLHVKNGFEISKSWSRTDVFPQLKLQGILSLKLLIGASVGISAGIFADCSVNVKDSSYVNTKIDMIGASKYFNPVSILQAMATDAFKEEALSEAIKEAEAKNYSRRWRVDGSVEGNISFNVKLSVGGAIWTEKISVSVFANNTLQAILKSPSMFKDINGSAWGLSISKKPGFELKDKIDVGVSLGLTLNIYEVIKGIQQDAISIGKSFFSDFYKTLMIEIASIANDYGLNDIHHQSLMSAAEAERFWECMENTLKKQTTTVEDILKEKNLDFNKDFTLKTWHIPIFNLPWFPSVNFKKYRQRPVSFSESGDTWEFQWKYNELGLLAWAGFRPLLPCIYIDGGKDDKATGLYFPKDHPVINDETEIENVNVTVKVSQLTPDKTYQAYPALALRFSDDEPFMFDTPQTVTSKSVDVTLKSVDVTPYYPSDPSLADAGYHGFEITGHVSVRGAAKVCRWGLFFRPFENAEMVQSDFRNSKVTETNDQPVTFYVLTKKKVFDTTMHGDYVLWKTKEDGEREASDVLQMNTLRIYGEWTDGFDFSDSRQRVPQGKTTAAWPEKVRKKMDDIIKNRPFYDTSTIVIAGD